jgi:hypothetical protein
VLYPYLFGVNLLLLVAVWTSVVLAQNGVWNIAVGDNLNRAVVVAELLLSDYVGVVAVNVPIDADNVAYYTRYGAYVVRHHHNGHLMTQVVK